MSVVAALDVMSIALALYVAALAHRISRAPGWRDLRWFARAALTVAWYSTIHVLGALAPSDEAVVLGTRFQVALLVVHSFAWSRYAAALLGSPVRWPRAAAVALAAAALVAAMVPSLAVGPGVTRPAAGHGLFHPAAELTAVGVLLVGGSIAALAVPLARFVAAWRRRVPGAGAHAGGLVVLVAVTLTELLAALGLLPLPSVADFALVVPIATVGLALTSRFVDDARSLQALRLELQREVAERTAQLGAARDQLHRAEQLAAIGRFAAGVAHEVNNPSAVVASNLRWLAEEVRRGEPLGPDAREAIGESLTAVERIAAIVRQLLDASRVAASPAAPAVVPLRPAVEEAIRTARARCEGRVTLLAEVTPDLAASGHEGAVVQVLVNLVLNAAQAIPAERLDGLVRVIATPGGRGVLIAVEDNGTGMTPEVLDRVFEPFFTTKPFGHGSGLGLPVSRGLVTSLGGELTLESRAGEGTRAIVELPAAAEPPARASAA